MALDKMKAESAFLEFWGQAKQCIPMELHDEYRRLLRVGYITGYLQCVVAQLAPLTGDELTAEVIKEGGA